MRRPPLQMPFSLSDYEYEYPERLVAQRPLERRDASRLLLLDRKTGAVSHESFEDFPSHINESDVVVINTTRVIKARLIGTRENGRDAEVLLVHPDEAGGWLAMVHPGGKLKVGRTIAFGDVAELRVVDVIGGGLRRLELRGGIDWTELIERFGTVPLPPYVHRDADSDDVARYQTVFAKTDGSVAAPTAGLHFTPPLMERIREAGAVVADVVLHVGPGTFKPVQVENPAEHRMHAEWYSVSQQTADAVNSAREAGTRVWAVGTTVARVLETMGRDGTVKHQSGWTDLFIYPPYRFQIVNALLTNFHLPRSTLLMLVSAFGGHDHVMRAYSEAVRNEYRLFSYGDAMAIA